MDKKMMAAWPKLKAAYEEMSSCMAGYEPMASEKEMAGGKMPASMEMPTQEDDAEPGSYEGKGMMSGSPNGDAKSNLLMASMKKRGY